MLDGTGRAALIKNLSTVSAETMLSLHVVPRPVYSKTSVRGKELFLTFDMTVLLVPTTKLWVFLLAE